MSEDRPEYVQSDSYIDEGLDNCVDSGKVRNWGPWLGVLSLLIGTGLLASEVDELSGFGVGAIFVAAAVFAMSLIDRAAGVRTRNFLFDNPIIRGDRNSG